MTITPMDDVFTYGAESVFVYRGVTCWTKKIRFGMFAGTHNGYFRMIIPGITHQSDLDKMFYANGGIPHLPNGSRFTYLAETGPNNNFVIGFDGAHDHNVNNLLSREDAEKQIQSAVDFILDTGIGRTITAPA